MNDTTQPIGMLRNHTFAELQLGDSASIERQLTQQDIELFAVMSGDLNPAHLDAEYAAASQFHGVIAHGMWGGALISAVLGTRLPGPGTVYLSQTLKFRAPVRVGDRLTIGVTVSAKDEARRRVTLACRCVNQDGQAAIEGEALVQAPEQKIERPATTLPEVRLLAASGLPRLLDHVKPLGPIRVAVVHPCDALSLGGALDARAAGLIEPLLVGPRTRLEAVAAEAGLSLAGIDIEDVPHSHAAAARAPVVRAYPWFAGCGALWRTGDRQGDELAGLSVHRGAAVPRGVPDSALERRHPHHRVASPRAVGAAAHAVAGDSGDRVFVQPLADHLGVRGRSKAPLRHPRR